MIMPPSPELTTASRELAILDDDGQPVPVGEPGELYVRRYPGVFDGYYKNPSATRETQRGEWLSVGDVAYVDADGFYYICDRKRDMIISGGVNIYPAEIEDALHRHPDIDDVAVACGGDLAAEDTLAVSEALAKLRAAHPRRADVAMLRTFAGATEEEIAIALSVSPRTVEREWRFARAWLSRALAG